MEFIIYFFIVASTVMALILLFDTKQNTRLRTLQKENKDVQPLFLMKATEQKLRMINAKLYGMQIGTGMPAEQIYMNEGARKMAASELNMLINNYNSGKINIKTYSSQLSALLRAIEDLKGMNFEAIG